MVKSLCNLFKRILKDVQPHLPVCLRDLFELCMFSANKQSTRTSVYGWFSFLVESSECEHSVYAEKMVTIYSQNDGLGKSLRRFAWDSSREAAHYIIVGITLCRRMLSSCKSILRHKVIFDCRLLGEQALSGLLRYFNNLNASMSLLRLGCDPELRAASFKIVCEQVESVAIESVFAQGKRRALRSRAR